MTRYYRGSQGNSTASGCEGRPSEHSFVETLPGWLAQSRLRFHWALLQEQVD